MSNITSPVPNAADNQGNPIKLGFAGGNPTPNSDEPFYATEEGRHLMEQVWRIGKYGTTSMTNPMAQEIIMLIKADREKLLDELLSKLPVKHHCLDKSEDCTTCEVVANYNRAIEQVTALLTSYKEKS